MALKIFCIDCKELIKTDWHKWRSRVVITHAVCSGCKRDFLRKHADDTLKPTTK